MATAASAMLGLDFAQLIKERTKQFIGREWVFAAIHNWLNAVNGTRVFVLAGGPGSGKTAIAARIVQMHLGETGIPSLGRLSSGFLGYFHFCQAGLDSTLSPLTFVQGLSETLANRYPVYREALEKQGSQQYVIKSNVTVQGSVASNGQVIGTQIGAVHIDILSGDARPLFDQMVRRPLLLLCRSHPQESVVVLVDSLDEALTFNPENNIAQLLRLVKDFPPQVRFLLTCRSNDQRVVDLVGRPTLDLIDDAPSGVDEVEQYAWSRLNLVADRARSTAAKRVAEKSKGNFLYAYHVLNDLINRGRDLSDTDTSELPDELEDVYRDFLDRELASNRTRWNDVYRPLVGAVAVARGEGLTKAQLTGITGLAEDTATDVLKSCGQYLVGGEDARPYRIYHQSFRGFLLGDEKFTVFPTERNAAIARYLDDTWGSNWGTCSDEYALRYTPLHWAEAALAQDMARRASRTQALIRLTQNPKYQHRFERQTGDIPALKENLHRAVQVAALNSRNDMLPWLIKAPQAYVAFHHDYLRAEAVVQLSEQGNLDQAEARLRLFAEVDEDWRIAARLIIAWLGIERNAAAAQEICTGFRATTAPDPLPLLIDRVQAALNHQASFAFVPQPALTLELAEQLVKRVSGQEFDRELLQSVNPSLIVTGQTGPQTEMIAQRGYAAALDSPILVGVAMAYPSEGTALVDRYIDAHATYNYVEYRNRSLWFVLEAVLRHHPEQAWVKERLRHIFVAALTSGGLEYREMLPLTVLLLHERASGRDARLVADRWRSVALTAADQLQSQRGADDSWGNHKRRLTVIMEMYQLLFQDPAAASALLNRTLALPAGFAGFQSPAYLRLAEAVLACGLKAPGGLESIIEQALCSAHHVQDYRFCARVTARCNALKRWHQRELSGQVLAKAIDRLAAVPSDLEFAADHFVHDSYHYRDDNNPDILPITNARNAENLEQLVEVFQRPAVEFLRVNPEVTLTQTLGGGTIVRVPDPGLPPLLAIHFAARAMADSSLDDQRGELLRSLVPVAAINSTALDTLLSYLVIANQLDDEELLEEISNDVGPVTFSDIPPAAAQIGPDAATVV